MNNQRKALIIVVAIAGGALLVDRLILAPGSTGPKSASASTLVSEPVGANGQTVDAAAILAQARASIRSTDNSQMIGKRLVRVAGEQGLDHGVTQDAFRPHTSWLLLIAQETGPGGAQQNEDEAVTFAKEYKLTTLMHQSGAAGDIALIEGKFADENGEKKQKSTRPVRVGDVVPGSGFRLISTDTDTAVFEKDGLRAALRIDRPSLSR